MVATKALDLQRF